jgi:DNA mismatch repair ATPase MutL
MARKKKQDEDPSPENVNNPNSDDTFGLPEIEYQPLKREETPTTASTSQTTSQENQTQKEMEQEEVQPNENDSNAYYTNDDDNENSPWPRSLGIAAILLVIAGGAWYYYGVYKPKQQAAAAKAKQEQEAEAKKKDEDLAEQNRIENERRKADSLASATPATGIIDTLTERTGRYYVIVASGIDGDLIMDYAKKLAPKGLNPKIIPPHGKIKFYRLAIADGDTYASTQATADQLKSEYTAGTWVVKY